jgi:hypothetical protein
VANAVDLLRVMSYNSVPVADTRSLPRKPGIYYAVKGGRVLYVGLTVNLYDRWNSKGDRVHHKKAKLLELGNVRLHYRICGEHRLRLEEAKDIKLFNPPLNVQRPDPKLHDRGLARVDRVARDVFWTVAFGVAIAIGGGVAYLMDVNNSAPAKSSPARSSLTFDLVASSFDPEPNDPPSRTGGSGTRQTDPSPTPTPTPTPTPPSGNCTRYPDGSIVCLD